jgi:hypothetical protein
MSLTQEEMQATTNQIVPVTAWLDSAKLAIDKVALDGSVGYKYNAAHRFIGKVLCMPVCCAPCFAWSTIWRIFCCPVSCFRGYGPLSNNGCTDLSDSCIATFHKTMDGKNTLEIDSQNIASSELMQAIEYAVFKMKTVDMVRTRYTIADFMYPVYKKVALSKGVVFVGNSCTPIDLELLLK